MRINDITIGNLYIAGRQADVNNGNDGIPVVPIAIGRFTSVIQSCGRVIVPVTSNTGPRNLVVMVREGDALYFRNPRSAWGLLNLDYWHTVESTRKTVKRYDNMSDKFIAERLTWVPVVITPTQLRMTYDEYKMKADAYRDMVNTVRTAQQIRVDARKKLADARSELLDKIAPNSKRDNSNAYLYNNNDVMIIGLSDFLELAEKANVRGTKTKIKAVKKAQEEYKDAYKRTEKDVNCGARAGIASYRI